MKLPAVGEWWTYTSPFWPAYSVSFAIDDVVENVPYADSWVIYSNDDGLDYFVARMEDFMDVDSNWSLKTN